MEWIWKYLNITDTFILYTVISVNYMQTLDILKYSSEGFNESQHAISNSSETKPEKEFYISTQIHNNWVKWKMNKFLLYESYYTSQYSDLIRFQFVLSLMFQWNYHYNYPILKQIFHIDRVWNLMNTRYIWIHSLLNEYL